MASIPLPPTRMLAGVEVPDTPLIREALKFARAHANDAFYNHIQRCWIFGFIIAAKIPELQNRDVEAHALAIILHDLGFDPERKGATTHRRCEVDSAELARDFLRRQGTVDSWDSHRLQLVWDAIALHAIGSIVFYKEPVVQACAYGIWADFQGPDLVPNGHLTHGEYSEVVRTFPRLHIVKEMTEAWVTQCHWKPETTFDTVGAEIGAKYVPGYSEKRKTTLEFLEACTLDDVDPQHQA
ncbi:hypothetical protein BKA56DRAFT_496730 [Ilyonectria sp. MPI-CAGE-AT-0026]|nr:hypothetical protein BKA56DRAFT_496730 [Ilyonectria sp. MPI-CAGE-AT-0026]